jgi:putative intracellular protease/amidase
MPLVEESEAHASTEPKRKVAVLVFDGAEIIDFSGPWEVFGAADFDVYTVAATRAPVTTSMGMQVVPSYTFADAPVPSVLLVPGGSVEGARGSSDTLLWIRQTSARAEQTLSVCNGAFLLAQAGLLDGLSATTTDHLISKLAATFPKITVVSDRRFVDNGKIVTAAGLSSGIDGALHLVDKMLGRGPAEQVALGIEYDWHPEGTFVRAKLADHLIPPVDLDSIGHFALDRTEGTTDRWQMTAHGSTSKKPGELLDYLGAAFAKGKWKSVSSSPGTSEWAFDADGKPWTGTLVVTPPKDAKGDYVLRLDIARAK